MKLSTTVGKPKTKGFWMKTTAGPWIDISEWFKNPESILNELIRVQRQRDEALAELEDIRREFFEESC